MMVFAVFRNRWGLILLGMNFLLLGMLAGQLIVPPKVISPPPKLVDLAAAGERLKTGGQSDGNLSESYSQLIGQPVFHQDRSYLLPPKTDGGAVQAPPPDFTLTGYMEIPGRPGKAFLKGRSDGRSLAVAAGNAVDGWTVASVSSKHVMLRQGERSAEITRGAIPPGASVSVPAESPKEATKPPPLSGEAKPQLLDAAESGNRPKNDSSPIPSDESKK